MGIGEFLFGQIVVVLCFLLLTQPGVHHHGVRQQLHKPHLHPYGETVDGVILLCFVQILQTGFDHVGCFPQLVVVLHLAAAVGLQGMVEKFGFDPAGVHGHHPDALGLQFPVHGPAVAEDEGLGGAVGGDIRHRLEGREAVQLQNMTALFHIGIASRRHADDRTAVEVYHVLQNGAVVLSVNVNEHG